MNEEKDRRIEVATNIAAQSMDLPDEKQQLVLGFIMGLRYQRITSQSKKEA